MLRRQTSSRRDDHFCLGRLFQPTEILYAAPGREDEMVAALVQAHALTYTWGRPWLPARFDVGEYCRTLLRVSFAAEIRPEPEGRAQALFEAQEAYLRPVYGTLLAALAASGELREEARGSTRSSVRSEPWSGCGSPPTSAGRRCGPPSGGRST